MYGYTYYYDENFDIAYYDGYFSIVVKNPYYSKFVPTPNRYLNDEDGDDDSVVEAINRIYEEEKQLREQKVEKPDVKSTTYSVYKRKYSDYKGTLYVLKHNNNSYATKKGVTYDPKHDDLLIFFDKEAANKAAKNRTLEFTVDTYKS